MKTTQLLSILLLLSLLSLSAAACSTTHHHHHHYHHRHRHHTTTVKKLHRKFSTLHIPHPHLGKPQAPKPVVVPATASNSAAENICSKTANPNFCLSALGPLARSVPKPSLMQMASFLGESAIKQTKVAVESPVRKGNEVCRNSYGTAVEGLQGMVDAMKAKSVYDANVYYNRLVGNYDACTKELEKVEGGTEYAKDDLTLKQMSEYLLAMVKELYPM